MIIFQFQLGFGGRCELKTWNMSPNWKCLSLIITSYRMIYSPRCQVLKVLITNWIHTVPNQHNYVSRQFSAEVYSSNLTPSYSCMYLLHLAGLYSTFSIYCDTSSHVLYSWISYILYTLRSTYRIIIIIKQLKNLYWY